MKVKDLIKKLQAIDQNTIVVVTTDNYEQGQSKVEANNLFEFKGEKKEEEFRDDFDGGRYFKKIIRYNEKGKTKFVQIT